MKIAAHETGHMFSIQHGILYQCGMCGSNHQQESDRRPLWFCPECDAKVWLATGADPVERYEKLEAFCRHNSLKAEAAYFMKAAAILDGKPELPAANPQLPTPPCNWTGTRRSEGHAEGTE